MSIVTRLTIPMFRVVLAFIRIAILVLSETDSNDTELEASGGLTRLAGMLSNTLRKANIWMSYRRN